MEFNSEKFQNGTLKDLSGSRVGGLRQCPVC